MSQYGLPAYDAKLLCAERPLAEFFEACAQHYKDYKKLSNWFQGELARLLNESNGAVTISTLKFTPGQLGELLTAVEKGTLSNNAAKDVLGEMFRTGKAPDAIIAEKGLAQVSDTGAVEAVVDEILAKNAGEVEKYRAGKKQIFGFFVGQVMKAMKGKGNPTLVNDLLKKKLGD
jgi:aspartyl-tRNA(Asn)/glutamyl-tRNA(Gln) amidotransferase subunit B